MQSATFQETGTDRKQYIEANPQFKTINIYDSNLQRMDKRQATKETQSEGEQQSSKQEQKSEKQQPEGDEPDMPKAQQKKKRAQKVS